MGETTAPKCWGCADKVPLTKGGTQHAEETGIPGLVYEYPCTAVPIVPYKKRKVSS